MCAIQCRKTCVYVQQLRSKYFQFDSIFSFIKLALLITRKNYCLLFKFCSKFLNSRVLSSRSKLRCSVTLLSANLILNSIFVVSVFFFRSYLTIYVRTSFLRSAGLENVNWR